MNYYKIVVNCGHLGCSKFLEVTRYFKDCNIVNAYFCALNMPRSKKLHSVKLVKEISFDEYRLGKVEEASNPYLKTYEGGKIYA